MTAGSALASDREVQNTQSIMTHVAQDVGQIRVAGTSLVVPAWVPPLNAVAGSPLGVGDIGVGLSKRFNSARAERASWAMHIHWIRRSINYRP